jgi:hypothetical protein
VITGQAIVRRVAVQPETAAVAVPAEFKAAIHANPSCGLPRQMRVRHATASLRQGAPTLNAVELVEAEAMRRRVLPHGGRRVYKEPPATARNRTLVLVLLVSTNVKVRFPVSATHTKSSQLEASLSARARTCQKESRLWRAANVSAVRRGAGY